jgi:PA domain
MTVNSRFGRRALVRACGMAAAILTLPAISQGAATIAILNNNAAGVGFNDPAPAAPVGGNPGTTLGQQRLNAFQAAANIWGAQLNSTVTIVVRAQLVPLTCNATGAVLGSAGPITVSRDFIGAPQPLTWYHAALANARAGVDLIPPPDIFAPDISASFNSNLGNVGCLTGIPFYLGLDNNHGSAIDLVTVLLHEFGHGLGFSTVTNAQTGVQIQGLPSAFDHFMFDTTQNLSWVNMTNAQRATSAVNSRRLAWTGPNVFAAVPAVLQAGTPSLIGLAPASVAGNYSVGNAQFGPPLVAGGLDGEVMPVVDQANGTGLACTPLSAANALAVNGKIALVDRGVCTFPEKAKNVQNAGAKGVIVVDNVAGAPPPGLGGIDATITIPSVRITLADGAIFKSALRFRSRTKSGVMVRMGLDMSVYSGADPAGRALMYTPNPFQGGSSVSHWDTIATPNLLMEPSINGDLSHFVTTPQDLTFALLRDLGWNP